MDWLKPNLVELKKESIQNLLWGMPYLSQTRFHHKRIVIIYLQQLIYNL